MLTYEAPALWEAIQRAKATGNHAEEKKLMKQYHELTSRCAHEDDEEILERRLGRMEKRLERVEKRLRISKAEG